MTIGYNNNKCNIVSMRIKILINFSKIKFLGKDFILNVLWIILKIEEIK